MVFHSVGPFPIHSAYPFGSNRRRRRRVDRIREMNGRTERTKTIDLMATKKKKKLVQQKNKKEKNKKKITTKFEWSIYTPVRRNSNNVVVSIAMHSVIVCRQANARPKLLDSTYIPSDEAMAAMTYPRVAKRIETDCFEFLPVSSSFCLISLVTFLLLLLLLFASVAIGQIAHV